MFEKQLAVRMNITTDSNHEDDRIVLTAQIISTKTLYFSHEVGLRQFYIDLQLIRMKL